MKEGKNRDDVRQQEALGREGPRRRERAGGTRPSSTTPHREDKREVILGPLL